MDINTINYMLDFACKFFGGVVWGMLFAIWLYKLPNGKSKNKKQGFSTK